MYFKDYRSTARLQSGLISFPSRQFPGVGVPAKTITKPKKTQAVTSEKKLWNAWGIFNNKHDLISKEGKANARRELITDSLLVLVRALILSDVFLKKILGVWQGSHLSVVTKTEANCVFKLCLL